MRRDRTHRTPAPDYNTGGPPAVNDNFPPEPHAGESGKDGNLIIARAFRLPFGGTAEDACTPNDGRMAENPGNPFAPFVTVVSGLPRSGTSMMMQMLAAGGMPVLADGARGPDTDNPRGYYEFEPAKRTGRPVGRRRGRPGGEGGPPARPGPARRPRVPGGVHVPRRAGGAGLAGRNASPLGPPGGGPGAGPAGRTIRRPTPALREWVANQPRYSGRWTSTTAGSLRTRPLKPRRVNQFLGGRLDKAKMAAAVEPDLYRQRLGDRDRGLPG